MTELSTDQARRAIANHTRRLADAAVAAGPDAAVPTAPAWTVADLVAHFGQTQYWVAEIIERRITDPTQLPTEMAAPPADPTEWPAWLTESAQRVATACSDDAMDAPVFNAAGDGRSGAQFWLTSMVNEAVIHGFDATNAANRPADIVRTRHQRHRTDVAVAGHRHRGRVVRRAATGGGEVAARSPTGRRDADRPGELAAADVDSAASARRR